jgi:RHS repeat-associated protein
VAVTAFTQTIDHYYDPAAEFLELGVNENGRVTWKLMGPDLDGRYGGQNGTGGFEAIVPGPELFCPMLSDAHGNAHALFDQGHSNLVWFASRLTGYGAVPGYRPVPLGQIGANVGAKYAWRNRAMSSVGLVYLGANWYDPVSGQFVSPDPRGHQVSPSLYSFAHGNPWAFWDADGRGKPVSFFDLSELEELQNFDSDWLKIDQRLGQDEPCIMCHGVSASGFNGDPTSFSSYLPGSGPHAREGYAELRFFTEYMVDVATAFASAGRGFGRGNMARPQLAGPTENWANYLAADARIGTTPTTLAEIEDAVRLAAGSAVTRTEAANIPRSFGRFGTAAHSEMEPIVQQIGNQMAAERSTLGLAAEEFRDVAGNVTARRAAGSLGVDAVAYQNGVPVMGFDLKTGAAWSAGKLNQVQTRFNNIPIIQIQTK